MTTVRKYVIAIFLMILFIPTYSLGQEDSYCQFISPIDESNQWAKKENQAWIKGKEDELIQSLKNNSGKDFRFLIKKVYKSFRRKFDSLYDNEEKKTTQLQMNFSWNKFLRGELTGRSDYLSRNLLFIILYSKTMEDSKTPDKKSKLKTLFQYNFFWNEIFYCCQDEKQEDMNLKMLFEYLAKANVDKDYQEAFGFFFHIIDEVNLVKYFKEFNYKNYTQNQIEKYFKNHYLDIFKNLINDEGIVKDRKTHKYFIDFLKKHHDLYFRPYTNLATGALTLQYSPLMGYITKEIMRTKNSLKAKLQVYYSDVSKDVFKEYIEDFVPCGDFFNRKNYQEIIADDDFDNQEIKKLTLKFFRLGEIRDSLIRLLSFIIVDKLSEDGSVWRNPYMIVDLIRSFTQYDYESYHDFSFNYGHYKFFVKNMFDGNNVVVKSLELQLLPYIQMAVFKLGHHAFDEIKPFHILIEGHKKQQENKKIQGQGNKKEQELKKGEIRCHKKLTEIIMQLFNSRFLRSPRTVHYLFMKSEKGKTVFDLVNEYRYFDAYFLFENYASLYLTSFKNGEFFVPIASRDKKRIVRSCFKETLFNYQY